jgi:hypothetical protein
LLLLNGVFNGYGCMDSFIGGKRAAVGRELPTTQFMSPKLQQLYPT